MYENNEEIYHEETDETGGSAPGVRDVYNDDGGPWTASVSAGDAGAAAAASDGFDYEEFAMVLSDALAGSVSGSDSLRSDLLVQEEISNQLAELNASVQGISALVSLILTFLLLDWTSRKLLAVVNRFTGRRR